MNLPQAHEILTKMFHATLHKKDLQLLDNSLTAPSIGWRYGTPVAASTSTRF
jgi:hypothetical protein